VKEEMTTSKIGHLAATVLTAGALMLTITAGAALAQNQINCGSLAQDPLTPECFGTAQDDGINAREVRDIIYAKGGNDTNLARGGDDEVYGGAGQDSIVGAQGDDKLYGGDNADNMTEEAYITPQGDTDELYGAAGNDSLSGFDDDYKDTLVCGAGADDTVYFDKDPNTGAKDSVSQTCENRRPNQSDGT
jgi:Ca2+-binding RTX toxin-like protein